MGGNLVSVCSPCQGRLHIKPGKALKEGSSSFSTQSGRDHEGRYGTLMHNTAMWKATGNHHIMISLEKYTNFLMMAPTGVKFSGGKIVPHSDLRAGTTSAGLIKQFRNRCSISRIGTWNVRSMRQVGKLENLKLEMNRLDLDIVGISEIRWPESGDFWSGDFRVIHSGSVAGNSGVGIVMCKKVGQSVESYLQKSDRIVMVRLNTKPVTTVLVQVYMPTSTYSEEDVEAVYSDIEDVLRLVKGHENLMIVGDFNAVVGEGKEGTVLGSFGLGNRNDRGARLVDFCDKHKLIVANTLFDHHVRRRYTWKMPGDISRYQLDYILVRQRFKNQVKDCRSYPGADIDSDHNLLVMKTKLNFKILKKGTGRKCFDIDKLKDKITHDRFAKKTDEILKEEENKCNDDVEAEWNCIKYSLESAAKDVLGHKRNEIRKPWITNEIVGLIEERRKYKNKLDEEGQKRYKKIKWEIIRKCREAKEQWIDGKCKEVEYKLEVGKTDEAFRIIKRNFREIGHYGKNVRNKEGDILIGKEERADRWKEYLEDLYGGQELGNVLEREENVETDELGCPIMREEFELALKKLRNNKAPGVDGLQAETIKHAGQQVRDRLFKLVSCIYETGKIPEDYKKNVIVTIPKKRGADRCENFRTISLTSHASKILTRIVQSRMENRAEEILGEDQFGFRRNKGTREAILALRIIIEKSIEKRKKVYIGFVDLEKAFDNVKWGKMFEILKNLGIRYRDRRVIYNLYREQRAVLEMDGEKREVNIRKGVRQGCAISPLIFNLYIEDAINIIKDRVNSGVNVQGKQINMLRFADDIAVLATSKEELEIALNDMEEVLTESYGMKINKNKTKILVCNGSGNKAKTKINIGGKELEEVANFCYLGSQIKRDGRCCMDIKQRLAQGRVAFNKKKSLLCSKLLKLETRKLLLKTYVWSTAFYGCETWTVGAADKKKIEAFEMWCYRRMLRISWTERVSNEEVLQRVGEQRYAWTMIKKRRDKMIGHILRHEGLVRDILEAETGVKRGQGRPRLDYCSQIVRDVGCSNFREMRRLAQDRKEWRCASNQFSD